MITLNFELTKEDYFQFYYYITWLAPGKKAAALKQRIRIFLLFTLAFTMIKFADAAHSFDAFFFYTIIVLASIYVFPLFYMKATIKKQADAFSNNPLNAAFLQPTELIFSETGIFTKDKYAEVKYNWISIVKKEENSDYFFLYVSSIQALLIPKRALRSEDERLRFIKLLSQHISFDAEVGHLANK
jgi:YcxB-like protein